MPDPLVSVAIANFNGATYLERTIRSVLDQRYSRIRVTIVDNASTDRSLAVARSFSDPRLAVASYREHVSVTANWNRALETIGSADYFALLHSDDIWHPDFLPTMVQALENEGDAWFAVCNANVIDEDDHVVDRATFRRKRRATSGRLTEAEYERLLCEMSVYPCSWLGRVSLAHHVRFNESLVRAPDWDYWLRIADEPSRVINVPSVLCGYRVHGSNDTFNPATLIGMTGDEEEILAGAINRHSVGARVQRRARRMLDARVATRTAQVLARGDFVLAWQLTAHAVRAHGPRRVAVGWCTMLALPEFRLGLLDALRARMPRRLTFRSRHN